MLLMKLQDKFIELKKDDKWGLKYVLVRWIVFTYEL